MAPDRGARRAALRRDPGAARRASRCPTPGRRCSATRPLRVELLTNRVGAADRRRILAALAAGEVDVAIGTHALIQEGVDFASLGAVVIDEQHRFGVEQRAALRDKAGGGPVPDVLVMTATPIPRTAAMTVYGDLDVTVIRSPSRAGPHSRSRRAWARGRGRRGRGVGRGARGGRRPGGRPTWCAR